QLLGAKPPGPWLCTDAQSDGMAYRNRQGRDLARGASARRSGGRETLARGRGAGARLPPRTDIWRVEKADGSVVCRRPRLAISRCRHQVRDEVMANIWARKPTAALLKEAEG